MKVRFIKQIGQVSANAWNALQAVDYPFLRHEFLHALESSGSASAERAWQPCHALVYLKGKLIGCMPLYIKTHPNGEYVFDHVWELAFRRHGLDYYPKLVSAVPFTPVRGPRYFVEKGRERAPVVDVLCEAVRRLLKEYRLSSWHVLFPDQQTVQELREQKLMVRDGVNFFWQNHGYQNFDDFLNHCSARKRKNIRKERKQIDEAGIRVNAVRGPQLSESDWQFFYRCYQDTYAKRSGHGGYLSMAFFQHIAAHFCEQVVMFIAQRETRPIAAALAFCSQDTLYGRYWGCTVHVDKLHFETCYYREIEYCIDQKLAHLDGGVQGEHKIQRGFVPTTTHSCHWIEDDVFRDAIAQYLAEEGAHMERYKHLAHAHLPFKKSGNNP